MKIVPPSHEILFMPEGPAMLANLERAGRTCYKSEERISEQSAREFVRRLIASGHHSVIEHASISVRFVCDRGVTHELVRHRLAAFSQESTRYANYGQEKFGGQITVIRPLFWLPGSPAHGLWLAAMAQAEAAYLELLRQGSRPQEARSVLPNSLKTEIVMTANLREWRHVINLRGSRASHPQMREIILPLLDHLRQAVPVVFDDLYDKYQDDCREMAAQMALADGAAT
ncbi:MAG: FAD-dependent thymidylate synthase [Pseudomonadota bacterium]